MTSTCTSIPTATFAFPTRVVFGPDVIEQLADFTVELRMHRPLVVTDAGVVEAGLLDRITAPLKRAHVQFSVYDGAQSNPRERSVLQAVHQYRADGCDGLIGLGGGSALDAAKGVRLCLRHTRPLHEYDFVAGGEAHVTADMPPLIAVPTTAGTGSEVSRSTLIQLDDGTGRKAIVFSPHLIPTLALADPRLTLELPPRLTAWTGFHALSHNVEALLARGFHPMCDAIALRGVELVGRWLRRAVTDGHDEEARANMMIASMMGAVAYQKGLGTGHSLAHPLSAVAGLHHGLANAIVLPHVLAFNAEAAPEQVAAVGRGLGAEATPQGARSAVEALLDDVGIPRRLRDVGVKEEHVELMVPLAMKDGCHAANPRPTTEADFRALYRAAL